MNEFLAEMFNTRETIGAPSQNADVEKLAEAQLLDEALQAEGVDIDKLPPETILKVAHTLFGDNSQLVKAASAQPQPQAQPAARAPVARPTTKVAAARPAAQPVQAEETLEEKVAQADLLGRVMAHSYVNELASIEKQAGLKDLAGKAGEGAKHHFSNMLEGAKKHPKTTAAVGGAAAAGAGFAAGRASKKKEASALEILAEKRATEWLEVHGISAAPAAQESTDEAKLAAAVDQRAAEMLAEAGIDVAAVEAAAQ